MNEQQSNLPNDAGRDNALARHALAYAAQQAQSAKITCDNSGRTTSDDWIPGFTKLGRLGGGGQGTVYRALQHATRRIVAVKELHESALNSAQRRARFAQEICVLAQLRHPNIVRLHDGVTDGDRCYLVMDYVDGESLDKYLETRDEATIEAAVQSRAVTASIDKLVRLFIKACEGVQAAHLRGIIHRDLKPSNILVDSNGEPHILDFGLAKIVPSENSPFTQAQITATGQVVGSLLWSSPEQIASQPEDLDVRTDVYSLGVVLYFALTGQMPFDVNRPMAEVIDQIRSDECSDTINFPRDVRPDLRAITLNALQKDRSRRYQSVGALRADLQNYLDGAPISVRSGETWYRLTKTVRRHRALTGIVAMAVIFLLVYTTSVTILLKQARQAERREARSASDARRFLEATDLAFQSSIEEAKNLQIIPGTTEVREALLQTYMDALQPLASQPLLDSRLRRQLARSLSGLADWAWDLQLIDQCRTVRRNSLKLFEELAREDPANPDLQRELANELVRGEAPSVAVDTIDPAWRSHEILSRLVRDYPENMGYLDDFSWSLDRIGGRALRERNFKMAQEYLELRYRVTEKLVAAEPTNPIRLSGLRYSHSLLGETYSCLDQADLAQQHILRAGELLEQLHVSFPVRLDFACDLAGWYISRAVWLSDCDDPNSALLHVEKAAGILGRIALNERNHFVVPQLQGRLASTLACIYYRHGGDPIEFERVAHEARQLSVSQLAQSPDSIEWLEGVIRNQLLWAIASHRLGLREQARDIAIELKSFVNQALVHPNYTILMLEFVSDAVSLSLEPPELYDPLLALEIAERTYHHMPNDRHVMQTLAKAQHAVGDDTSALTSIEIAMELSIAKSLDSAYDDLLKTRRQIIESLNANLAAPREPSISTAR